MVQFDGGKMPHLNGVKIFRRNGLWPKLDFALKIRCPENWYFFIQGCVVWETVSIPVNFSQKSAEKLTGKNMTTDSNTFPLGTSHLLFQANLALEISWKSDGICRDIGINYQWSKRTRHYWLGGGLSKTAAKVPQGSVLRHVFDDYT